MNVPSEGGAERWASAGSFETQRPSGARPLLVPRRGRPRLCRGMPGVPASIPGPPAAGLAAGAKPFLFRLRVGSGSGLLRRRPRSGPAAGRDARGSPQGWGQPGDDPSPARVMSPGAAEAGLGLLEAAQGSAMSLGLGNVPLPGLGWDPATDSVRLLSQNVTHSVCSLHTGLRSCCLHQPPFPTPTPLGLGSNLF